MQGTTTQNKIHSTVYLETQGNTIFKACTALANLTTTNTKKKLEIQKTGSFVKANLLITASKPVCTGKIESASTCRLRKATSQRRAEQQNA